LAVDLVLAATQIQRVVLVDQAAAATLMPVLAVVVLLAKDIQADLV
jgi:hypothetical protein